MARKQKRFVGVLDPFFETGMERIHWALIQEGKTGSAATIFIDSGDYLKIFNGDGTVLFKGEVLVAGGRCIGLGDCFIDGYSELKDLTRFFLNYDRKTGRKIDDVAGGSLRAELVKKSKK